jgi:hypothetical protein
MLACASVLGVSSSEINLPKPCFAARTVRSPNNECISCKDVKTLVRAAEQTTQKLAAAGCERDDDCTMHSAQTKCFGHCPTAINRTNNDAFIAAITAVSAQHCAQYARVCGYMTPRCMAMQAQCVDGACTAVRQAPTLVQPTVIRKENTNIV